MQYVKTNERTDKYLSLLKKRKRQSRYRTLSSVEKIQDRPLLKIDGSYYLDFCSNDYLGLSDHPHIKMKSIENINKFGTSSSASRLVTGSLSIHHELEDQLSKLYQREALIFNSGYQANATIIPALTDRHDCIISDKKCHNSILQGCISSNAQHYRYQHSNTDHLEKLLISCTDKNSGIIWVITESVFSMDGDIAPLDEIIALCKKYGAYLYVDDAHSTGLFGNNGLGLGADYDGINLLLETFGKAVGAFGAVALVDKKTVKDYLINFCGGFIYSTSLPPAVIGAVSAAFELIPEMSEERQKVKQMSDLMRTKLHESGYDTLNSNSQIIPILTGADSKACELTRILKNNGIYISAIRPPTVPKGESRLRITLSARHRNADIETLVKALPDEY